MAAADEVGSKAGTSLITNTSIKDKNAAVDSEAATKEENTSMTERRKKNSRFLNPSSMLIHEEQGVEDHILEAASEARKAAHGMNHFLTIVKMNMATRVNSSLDSTPLEKGHVAETQNKEEATMVQLAIEAEEDVE